MNPISEENFGVYIHFPFCKSKCLYCDFYSIAARFVDWNKYGIAVENEFNAFHIPDDALVSLYLGGGTPSLAPPSLVARFRDMIQNKIGEFTIEVNPEDVTELNAKEWKKAGVNRISMGVQSMVDNELHTIGRRHNSAAVIEAYGILRNYFTNISLDLIFGLPGQTSDTLDFTLSAFLEMRPEHISAYSLMYEERAAITRLRDSGRIEEMPEEDSVEMFRKINRVLREAGYERYEISNYALPGFRSHHNSNYWRGMPYIGLGPGAHSYDGNSTRRFNKPDLSLYIKEWLVNVSKEDFKRQNDFSLSKPGVRVWEEELLGPDELREEMLLTRLRTSEGLNLEEYSGRFGEKERKILMKKATPFIASGGLILEKGEILVLTEEGVMISDEIIASLF